MLLNLREMGRYQCAPRCYPPSRERVGYNARFGVVGTGTDKYIVGGHIVHLCKAADGYHGSCDCYDFGVYGSGFSRPCWHIWAAFHFGDVPECE